MNEEIIKKCEGIDKAKEELSLIEQFDQIYSNFMIAKRTPRIPKIIKDEELSPILNVNDEEILLDEKNLYDDNYANMILRKPSLELNKKNEMSGIENNNNENENDTKENKLIKSIIESSKELISKKLIANEIKQINRMKTNINNNGKNDLFSKRKEEDKNNKLELNNIININNKDDIEKRKNEKRIRIQNIIEKMKKNKEKNRKSKEIINKSNKNSIDKNTKSKKNFKNKDKERKSMKDIYKHLYGIEDDSNISINIDKKYNIKNAHERLYNQGFYSKNKSQINILENINKIKKDSNNNNISQKSKQILGLYERGSKDIKNIYKKYDKNNIYKPIKTNNKVQNIELSFRPELNENTVRIAENMENSFIRITRPKEKIKVQTPKKILTKKEDYEKCIKRINYLYLDGVEKIKKKKLKSCPPTEVNEAKDLEIKKLSTKIKNSRNTYYNQIQWKKKIIFENINKKKLYDIHNYSECTFKPELPKRNLKKLFKKQLSEDDLCKKIKKNYFDIYFGPKLREFSVSKQRYFIINNDDIKNSQNSIYNKKDKNIESEKRNRHIDDNIKIGLIKRKLYNLEKFFSKKNL